ncbi:MAG: cation diffusion facilitator family transporter [Amaricoccus sp.]|uniref:cation diffusion facilitator family transporter n=1 Tax=Amaricoccus sp. TaxID=1872485 RepID=UPI003315902C
MTMTENARLMRQATYASVAVAGILIVTKLGAWLYSDSVALLASLIDSTLDALASLLNLVAVRQAGVPADREHRFGHGKAEALAGLGQSAFVAGSALFLGFEAVHRLLEHLRDADPAGWPALAARLLPGFPDPAEILAEAAAVLTAPALAEIFGPGTLAEVDIAAPLGALGGRTVVGRIDRLVVSGDRVLAVDFKSNRVVPDRPEQVPEGILRQMGAYHAALGHIWPGRRIEAAILWTRAARLMPLPAKLIGDALARAHLDPDGVGS